MLVRQRMKFDSSPLNTRIDQGQLWFHQRDLWLTSAELDFTIKRIPSAVVGTYHAISQLGLHQQQRSWFHQPTNGNCKQNIAFHGFWQQQAWWKQGGRPAKASPWRVGRVEWQPMRNRWRVPSPGSERWTGIDWGGIRDPFGTHTEHQENPTCEWI